MVALNPAVPLIRGSEHAQGLARRAVGVVAERVKLDRHPAVVPGRLDRGEDLGEVDRPGARHEVVVDPLGGDVLDVEMPDVRAQLGIAGGQVFPDAKGVADVEVQTDRRGVHPLGHLKILVGRLQQQPRLGLDEQEDADLVGVLGERLEDLDEQVDRLLPRLPLGDRAARLGGDVRGAEFGAKGQGTLRVVDPDLPVMRLGVDERRVPVRLPAVGDAFIMKALTLENASPCRDIASRIACLASGRSPPARRGGRRPCSSSPRSRSPRSAGRSPRTGTGGRRSS